MTLRDAFSASKEKRKKGKKKEINDEIAYITEGWPRDVKSVNRYQRLYLTV